MSIQTTEPYYSSNINYVIPKDVFISMFAKYFTTIETVADLIRNKSVCKQWKVYIEEQTVTEQISRLLMDRAFLYHPQFDPKICWKNVVKEGTLPDSVTVYIDTQQSMFGAEDKRNLLPHVKQVVSRIVKNSLGIVSSLQIKSLQLTSISPGSTIKEFSEFSSFLHTIQAEVSTNIQMIGDELEINFKQCKTTTRSKTKLSNLKQMWIVCSTFNIFTRQRVDLEQKISSIADSVSKLELLLVRTATEPKEILAAPSAVFISGLVKNNAFISLHEPDMSSDAESSCENLEPERKKMKKK